MGCLTDEVVFRVIFLSIGVRGVILLYFILFYFIPITSVFEVIGGSYGLWLCCMHIYHEYILFALGIMRAVFC